MPTDEELIARLGSTNASDRAVIERGTTMLAALDAIVSDASQPMPRRMTATRIANEIRVQSLHAPGVPSKPVIETGEARAYFTAGGALTSDHQQDPATFVERLYDAGAVRVVITDDRSKLVAELPASGREALFAIYNEQVDEYGEEFGGEEITGHEMTAEEAAAIGVPEAEGEFVADDFHATDCGQTHLHFWWD